MNLFQIAPNLKLVYWTYFFFFPTSNLNKLQIFWHEKKKPTYLSKSHHRKDLVCFFLVIGMSKRYSTKKEEKINHFNFFFAIFEKYAVRVAGSQKKKGQKYENSLHLRYHGNGNSSFLQLSWRLCFWYTRVKKEGMSEEKKKIRQRFKVFCTELFFFSAIVFLKRQKNLKKSFRRERWIFEEQKRQGLKKPEYKKRGMVENDKTFSLVIQ